MDSKASVRLACRLLSDRPVLPLLSDLMQLCGEAATGVTKALLFAGAVPAPVTRPAPSTSTLCDPDAKGELADGQTATLAGLGRWYLGVDGEDG